MRLPTITDSASASGKANRSTPCVRWLKARSDHGRTTSTTRCTWTDLRRSSESNRLIAATQFCRSAWIAVWGAAFQGGFRVGDLGGWHRAALSSSDMAGTHHVGAGSLTWLGHG